MSKSFLFQLPPKLSKFKFVIKKKIHDKKISSKLFLRLLNVFFTSIKKKKKKRSNDSIQGTVATETTIKMQSKAPTNENLKHCSHPIKDTLCCYLLATNSKKSCAAVNCQPPPFPPTPPTCRPSMLETNLNPTGEFYSRVNLFYHFRAGGFGGSPSANIHPAILIAIIRAASRRNNERCL